MKKTETLESFYKEKFTLYEPSTIGGKMQFAILNNEQCAKGAEISYRRRDFYKIALFKGHVLLHYGDKSLEVKGTALVFFNADVPYTVEMLEESNFGGYLVFRESYYNEYFKNGIRELPLFTNGAKPVFILNKTQQKAVDQIFKKMQADLLTDYEFKHDLIRTHLTELIHLAMKMTPSNTIYQFVDAKARIAAIFRELLDRQFPIDTPSEEFEMRSAAAYADKLGVHVNYLNRAVKSVTGKTTTNHISDRVTMEAISMLKHSSWNIAEISYSLGFENPSNFSHFIKKHTKQIPSKFRLLNDNNIQH